FEPNGQYAFAIRDGWSFLNGNFVGIRLVRQEQTEGGEFVDTPVVFDLDNRGPGFGTSGAVVTEVDENFDIYEIEHSIDDPLGNPVGVITQRFEIVELPLTDGQKRAVKYSWRFENNSPEF